MMAAAVASELGALLLNISPGKLKGHFLGKNGATKMMHCIYSVAKDAAFAPVVVYFDECEQFFAGGGGKKNKTADKEGSGRFKKDLNTYKNAFSKEDRVIFIGNTNAPDKGDVKDLRAFFDKQLYMPNPDYASRLMLWRRCIQMQLALGPDRATCAKPPRVQNRRFESRNRAEIQTERRHRSLPDDFDLSTLAHISEGFSAGSICATVLKTLTKRRVERLDKRPHNEIEFLNSCVPLADSPDKPTQKRGATLQKQARARRFEVEQRRPGQDRRRRFHRLYGQDHGPRRRAQARQGGQRGRRRQARRGQGQKGEKGRQEEEVSRK
jgi:SpoVK/Ycf46/Vps4 family AAA+-type ATPase